MTPSSDAPGSGEYDLIVAGGGAAGFFGAIACAESHPGARILILEKSRQVLGKVKISGGGRCNLTHACFDPQQLVTYYPRGSPQLIGPFYRWGPADTMAWFEDRGVPLKIEADNRVFPRSDNSQTIIDCLTRTASDTGIEIATSTALQSASKDSDRALFDIALSSGENPRARHLLLTTGGTRNPIGATIAAGFGHRTEPAVPSLFTFNIADPRIDRLQGLSVANAKVSVAGLDLNATGPVLVTHWGLSGPAILRVSAWGARQLQAVDYHFEIIINWCGDLGEPEILDRFDRLRIESPKRRLANDPQFDIPSRLWKRLIEAALAQTDHSRDISDLRWPHLPRHFARGLARQLSAGRFTVEGKSINKDEFVTCGGIELAGIQFKTMESRITEGLHFAGEVLDIDGLTGGFNFQAAWTTGRLAGEAIAASLQASPC